MKKLTGGRWDVHQPATNALWLHYLADTLLNKKTYPMSPAEKKRLRDFRWGRHCLFGQLITGQRALTPTKSSL